MTLKMNNIKTLRELMSYSINHYAEDAAFYIRNKESYDTIKYHKFVSDTFALATHFVRKGYSGRQVALIGENSYQWVVTYMAAVSSGATIVPIDKELQPKEIVGLVTMSGSVAVIYSTAYSYVIYDEADFYSSVDCYVIGGSNAKLSHPSLDEVIEQVGDLSKDGYTEIHAVELNPDAMCSIVFTSGTTGVSKGVMLSHMNLLSDSFSCHEFIRFGGNRFSLLPMHHTYEFTLGVVFAILQGCAISVNHSIKYISQNLQIFAPTDLIVVPLVAETLYNSIWTNIRTSGKEPIVRKMIKISNMLLRVGIDLRPILFKKIHKALGGRVRNIFCGGAHIDADIARGYIDFGFNFFIGYGITECSPLITANMSLRHSKMASCGRAISCCDVKIDSPDANGEGEIMVKGKNVMLGYYNNTSATEQAMSDDWFRTGDIGRFDEDKFLYITGRIKNIIVLKNGKNVYPEELEGYLYKIPYIKEVVIYGSEGKAGDELSISAEIYPNIERCQSDNIVDVEGVIKKEIDKINGEVSYYKRVVKVTFRDNEFEKTTSKKIKRSIK